VPVLAMSSFALTALAMSFPSLPAARLVVRCDHLIGLECARPVLAPERIVETFYATTGTTGRLLPALDDLSRRTATRRGAVRSVVLSIRLAQREAA
jgi:hypothetical protein